KTEQFACPFLRFMRLFDNHRALGKAMAEIHRCGHHRIILVGRTDSNQIAHSVGWDWDSVTAPRAAVAPPNTSTMPNSSNFDVIRTPSPKVAHHRSTGGHACASGAHHSAVLPPRASRPGSLLF